MNTQKPGTDTISFLSVGTQILSKDLMDQYIRSLGKYRTHYGLGGESAKRILGEMQIDVIITEFWLPDGTAYDLIHDVHQIQKKNPIYCILAIDEDNPDLRAIAKEMEVDSVLVKPFTANDLKDQIDKFLKKLDDKTSSDWLIFQADNAIKFKNYPQAEKYFQAALKAAPLEAKTQYRLGMYYLWKPDYENAEKHFKQALTLNPKHVSALTGYGLLALRTNQFQLSESLLSQAQELSPLNPKRPVYMAQARLEWGAHELKKAILKYPNSRELQFEYGRFLVYQHDYAGAVQMLRKLKLLKTDPFQKEVETLIQVACKLGAIQ